MIIFRNASNYKAKSIHHFVLFIALLSYLIGFGAYFYSLSPIYTYIFTGAFIVVFIFFQKAQNAIIATSKQINQDK
tara:strand:+ start:587 stop:814 length:228 start_codon:yes stop_codon:yes gene_type:complete